MQYTASNTTNAPRIPLAREVYECSPHKTNKNHRLYKLQLIYRFARMIKGPHVSMTVGATIGRSSSSIRLICARAKRKRLHRAGWIRDGWMDGWMQPQAPVKGFNKSRHTRHTHSISISHKQHDNKREYEYIYKCKSTSIVLIYGWFLWRKLLVCHWMRLCMIRF